MNVKIDGNKFTFSATFTRPKVVIAAIVLIIISWLPYHFLQKANDTIVELKKQSAVSTPTVKLDIKEPIVSPYALSPAAKTTLNEWLLYGVQMGHDKMLERYNNATQGKDEFKPFLYVIETEWRLGHWESVTPPKTP